MASSTEPDRIDSRMKDKIPNFGCNSLPVRDRPPSAFKETCQLASSTNITERRTNEAFEIVAFLKKGVNVRLHKSGIHGIITKATTDPHGACDFSSVSG